MDRRYNRKASQLFKKLSSIIISIHKYILSSSSLFLSKLEIETVLWPATPLTHNMNRLYQGTKVI